MGKQVDTLINLTFKYGKVPFTITECAFLLGSGS